jgi:HK97 family phage prohead protease
MMISNRVYWGDAAPKNWKRATPTPQSIPSVPIELSDNTKAPSKSYRFTVSTNTVDRSGDTIDQSAWDLKAYRKNPVVLAFHDASTWPVGKATKIGVESGRLVAEVRFADTHEGRKAASLVDQGVLKATSVGFRPTKYEHAKGPGRAGGLDFKGQELMEFSVVPVPANPDCLICMSARDEREQKAAEILAEQRRLDALDAYIPESEESKPEPKVMAAIRAKRQERKRIAGMTVTEHTEWLNAKAAAKQERKRRLEEMRGQR